MYIYEECFNCLSTLNSIYIYLMSWIVRVKMWLETSTVILHIYFLHIYLRYIFMLLLNFKVSLMYIYEECFNCLSTLNSIYIYT